MNGGKARHVRRLSRFVSWRARSGERLCPAGEGAHERLAGACSGCGATV